jgi:uncharacterized membrane protein (DUF373 family)
VTPEESREAMKKLLLQVHEKFQAGVIGALMLLLMLVILVAVLNLGYLFVTRLADAWGEIHVAEDLKVKLHSAFGTILMVIIGIELLETLKFYFEKHIIRVEIIFLVALTAVARHVIEMDFEHASATASLGIAAAALALSAGYFLVKKAGASRGRNGSELDAVGSHARPHAVGITLLSYRR